MKFKVLALATVTVIGVLLPSAAHAVQWVKVGEGDRAWMYLDVDSVKRRGNTVQYWDQTVLKQPDENGLTSFQHSNVMNCATGIYHVLREISYIDGQTQSDIKTNEPFSVVAGSVGESMFKRVCKRR